MKAPRLKTSFVYRRLCFDPAMKKDLKCVQHAIWARTPNTHTHMFSSGNRGIWQCAKQCDLPPHHDPTLAGYSQESPGPARAHVR